MNDKFKTFHHNKPSFELLFAGDTSFGENYQESIKKNGGENILERFGYAYSFEKLKPLMQSADFILANLETPVTDLKNSPYEGQKDYIHWTDPEKAPHGLLKQHVSVVNLANNHTFDYGLPGFEQTLDVLEQHQMPIIGAGNNIAEAGKPFVGQIDFGHNKFNFALIGAFEKLPRYDQKYRVYSDDNKPGLMPLEPQKIAAEVKAIKTQNPDCFVIVLPHWGDNYSWRNEDQKRIAGELIDGGVDLILGSGSHMFQECEMIKGKWVIYSIGNFVFNSPGRYTKMKAPPYSFAAKLSVSITDDKVNLKLKLYPIMSDNSVTHYQPRPVNKNEWVDFQAAFIKRMSSLHADKDLFTYGEDAWGYYLALDLQDKNADLESSGEKWFGVMIYEKQNKRGNDIDKHLTRATTIERELRKHHSHVFLYTPEKINYQEKCVTGYRLSDEGKLVTATIPIPKINYDFYISSGPNWQERRVIYSDYLGWAKENGIDITPIGSFRRMVCDKFRSSEVLSEVEPSAVPRFEMFTNSQDQILSFLQSKDKVFLKPNGGNKGNHIFVIERTKGQHYNIDRYFDEEITRVKDVGLQECLDFVKKYASDDDYLIQEAIDVIQYEGRPVNIRVLLVFDGIAWRFMCEVYVAKKSSLIGNTYQGGELFPADVILPKLIPRDKLILFKDALKKLSIRFADYLYEKYQKNFEEIAFDYLVDDEYHIYVSEINVKPGLLGEPMEYGDFYNMSEQEKHNFETQSMVHGQYLAHALLNRYYQIYEKPSYWFHEIKGILALSINQADALLAAIYDAIDDNEYQINALSDVFEYDDSPRIVFISISDLKSRARVFLGSGRGLLAAVNHALSQAKQLPKDFVVQGIKLDLVTEVIAIKDHKLKRPFDFDRSIYGLAFDETIRLAFLPELLVVYTIVNSDSKLRPENIIDHFNVAPVETQSLRNQEVFNGYAFKTQSFFYTKGKTNPLYRGHLLYPHVDCDVLLASALSAGRYLQGSVKDNGDFDYEYLPKRDESTDRYNLLRHAGTVYAMLELVEMTHDDQLMMAAKRALMNLVNRGKKE